MFAIRHLIVLVQRYRAFDYGGLVVGADTTVLADGTRLFKFGCEGGFVSEPAGSLVATPLPANVADQVRTTLAALDGLAISTEASTRGCRVPFPVT